MRESLAALRAGSRPAARRQYFFKYCSTFDSHREGNIGPVADALCDALRRDFTWSARPSRPTAAPSIKGHLFVGDLLLSDSRMRHHPLTPMTDASLVRVIGSQTPENVGLVALPVVREGAGAVRLAAAALGAAGTRYAVADAVDDADLLVLARAIVDASLVVAGSGIGALLPAAYREAALTSAAQADAAAARAPDLGGRGAVDRGQLFGGDAEAGGAVRAAGDRGARRSARLSRCQRPAARDPAPGRHRTAREQAAARRFDRRARRSSPRCSRSSAATTPRRASNRRSRRSRATLLDAGVRKLVVAGGETSGAVVGALGVNALDVGPQIAPGVPWTFACGATPLALALKSGNFGQDDFFARALAMLP